MPVEMLEHYTIRCASLERTRDFYRDVLRLGVGDRPNFPFKGYWLYLGGVPIMHLVDAAESEVRDGPHAKGGTADLDHIAFRENEVPGARIRQIFVPDPDGVLIELNFRNSPA